MERREHCRYAHRACQRKPIDGYQYCIAHILEDKTSPYHQCTHISTKTGKRCSQACHMRSDKRESVCPTHQLKSARARYKTIKNNTKPLSAASLLENLEHYSSTLYNNNGEAKRSRSDMSNSRLASIVSSSDSDEDTSKFCQDSVFQPDSDTESVDSEGEDLFKYAEVMTAEEVTRITRDKLIRLQSLYIEQFKWLQHTLKERRRLYLHERAKEKEDAHHSGDETFKLTDCPNTLKYLALRRYHKRHGVEAVMHMRCQERRRLTADLPDHKPQPKCTFKSVKCHNKPLPMTKFCIHHIANDTHQVLFRQCGFIDQGPSCERIIVNFHESSHCDYHVNMSDLSTMVVEQPPPKQEQEDAATVDVTSIEHKEEPTPADTTVTMDVDPPVDETSQNVDVNTQELAVEKPEITT